MEVKEKKEFREERFEFALYVNNNVICKRNFKINDFIDESMNSIDFKYKVDEIVEMINNDLKSKSRVYTWFYYDPTDEEKNEFNSELIDPWECTFKFVVTDNKHEVITKIWDGRFYPKAIREKVDLTNKNVKITTKDGRTYTYDKESYFEENKDRLSLEMYVLKAMINDKQDLLFTITKKICEACSPRENSFQKTSDYTLSEEYKTKVYSRDEEGNVKLDSNGNPIIIGGERKKYFYSLKKANAKLMADWGAAVSAKTKAHMASLY